MASQETPLNSKIRVRIQSIIESNTIRSGVNFNVDELDENGLIYDLHNNFKLIPRESNVVCDDALKYAIKKSTKKVTSMINSKEFKQRVFLKILNETFEIQLI